MKYLIGDQLVCNFAANKAKVTVVSVHAKYLKARYTGGKVVKVQFSSIGENLDYEFAGQPVDMSEVEDDAAKAAVFYNSEITASEKEFPQTIRIANQLWHRKHSESSGYHYNCAVNGQGGGIAGMWIGLSEIRQHIASQV